ncbi:MAG: helix-turn-helix transcriptional regulator [Gemmatimonadota bacterium]|nr:helix-turn-helix transcriptional regulator [Gemmatimonadota bacterium]MDH3368387.1 helix-turn-helix transcriptional regulator [Gemmatimonadota bacterium]MDH3478724.1 helix-turn-helix transcriptional regulator [Gemmatimonadota bacterium]MDH3571801.1 helix-turn-helix transcriptional regulator [Gemmatimonadota bacterium]MDH5549586.1 helix-turn-helix transcriptional regulator [Gemmatimonadota bacterium]
MDVSLAIRQRLDELGLEQKGLARAARVTESYVSQLLTRKKAPPAPNRTDIYDKMDKFLKLPTGDLARVADAQRKQELKRELGDEPTPLFREVRALILRKCAPKSAAHVRAIFEKEPFGELERLVTEKLLDVVKRVSQEELENDDWLRKVARLGGCSYEEMRVIVLEFLDTDVFHVSAEQCVSFLDPLISFWDVNLATFGLDIALNHQVAVEHLRRFEFVERGPEGPREEPGLRKFLQDPSLSGSATTEELEFLKKLRFENKRPTELYYYRELQSLRDPLHFRAG